MHPVSEGYSHHSVAACLLHSELPFPLHKFCQEPGLQPSAAEARHSRRGWEKALSPSQYFKNTPQHLILKARIISVSRWNCYNRLNSVTFFSKIPKVPSWLQGSYCVSVSVSSLRSTDCHHWHNWQFLLTSGQPLISGPSAPIKVTSHMLYCRGLLVHTCKTDGTKRHPQAQHQGICLYILRAMFFQCQSKLFSESSNYNGDS